MGNVGSMVGVSTLGGGLVYGDGDDDDDIVTVRFGEPEGRTDPGFADPDHLTIELAPDPIDEGTTVIFDVATLDFDTEEGFHQVIIYEAGTVDTDVVVPLSPPFLFINPGTGLSPGPPFIDAALDPDVDTPLPDGVIAAGQFGGDLSFTFDKPGTYLVVCNITFHFGEGMFRFVTVLDDDADDDDDDDDDADLDDDDDDEDDDDD